MFIDRLLNQGNGPLLEQWLQFTDERQRLLAEDVSNISTPGFIQKDLSLQKFQEMLSQRVQLSEQSPLGSTMFDDVMPELQHTANGVLFHDGNNRSMEQLFTDGVKNGMMHTLAVELLRRQNGQLEMALKERVS